MNPEEYVGVGQSRVGRRELRGDPDRLREAFDTFWGGLFGLSVPEEAAPEIDLVGSRLDNLISDTTRITYNASRIVVQLRQ
jgi:hypothetical protein